MNNNVIWTILNTTESMMNITKQSAETEFFTGIVANTYRKGSSFETAGNVLSLFIYITGEHEHC